MPTLYNEPPGIALVVTTVKVICEQLDPAIEPFNPTSLALIDELYPSIGHTLVVLMKV